MRYFNSILVASVLSVFALASVTKASLVLNGSFESATSYPGTDSFNNPTGFTNWTSSSPFTNYVNGNALGGVTSAQEGNYYLNVSNDNTFIQQSFAVTGGTTYDVTYYESARSAGADQTATISLAAGTGGTSQLANSPSGSWVLWSFQFTPSASTTATLRFDFGSSSPLNTYLDNVAVNAVPEPTGIALLTGSVAFGLLKRRRNG